MVQSLEIAREACPSAGMPDFLERTRRSLAFNLSNLRICLQLKIAASFKIKETLALAFVDIGKIRVTKYDLEIPDLISPGKE